jgi:hypothetical protein
MVYKYLILVFEQDYYLIQRLSIPQFKLLSYLIFHTILSYTKVDYYIFILCTINSLMF